MDHRTQSELLSLVQQQLASLTSTIQLLQQSMQQTVEPQPDLQLNQQPLPSSANQSGENNQNLESVTTSNVGGRGNGKRKSIPETQLKPKLNSKQRRRTQSTHGDRLYQVRELENSLPSTTSNSTQATKKRLSILRKTVDVRPAVEVIGDAPIQPNIDRDVHATNDLYRILCLYCQTSAKYLVCHYTKQHPNHEVPISRLSPEMADRLRAQAEKFKLKMGKIEAFCFFCEENKKMPKHHWTQHFLLHTGEVMFACDTCNSKFKHKNDHKNCMGAAMNVYEKNSSDASLVGYMCKDCNYIQIHLSAIQKHLTNEHRYQSINESQYEKLMLIPDLSPVNSVVSSKYSFAEASQRFKCTVCNKPFADAEKFTAHLEEKHSQMDRYKCFCGESIPKNDQFSGMEWVAAHLLMHRTDLYQCMVCNGVFLRKNDVRTHMFKSHPGNEIKYQHVCRNPNRHIKIVETTVHNLRCNVCQIQMNGLLANALEHFYNKHPKDKVNTTGIVAKKITNLARISSETETVYEGGLKFNIQINT